MSAVTSHDANMASPTQLTNEATRLLAAERATTNEVEAKRLQAERDHVENMIRDRYQALLKSH